MAWLVFIGWVISQTNKQEDYSNHFRGGVGISMNWATTYFLIFGRPWSELADVSLSLLMCFSEHILRLKVQWKSTPPPSWTSLVLIGLCHVLGLCLYTFMSLFYACVLYAQSCLTLCGPMDYSLPSSSLHGIFQARYWSRLLFPCPEARPDPGIKTSSLVSCALAGSLQHCATWEAHIL